VDFLFGDRAMFHSARDDYEFSLPDFDIRVAQLHRETTFDHKEQFILFLVMAPEKWALELHQPDRLTVEFTRRLRMPVPVSCLP
jgi:hypothetical protein